MTRSYNAKPDSILIVQAAPSWTNDEVVESMRAMKEWRETHDETAVVCLIHGFNEDPRGLFDIPEARAFCRRLLSLGFISYLDFATTLPGLEKRKTARAWGAVEVWVCAEGLADKNGDILIDHGFMEDAERAVCESNRVADEALGPLKPRK